MHSITAIVIALGLVVTVSCIGPFSKEFKTGFNVYRKTGVKTLFLNEFVSKHALSNEVRNTNWNIGTPGKPRETICTMCDVAVTTVLDAYQAGMPPEEIRDVIVSLCELFNVQSDRVCEGVVDTQMTSMLYILNHTEGVTADRICSIVVQSDNCGQDDPNLDWSIDLDDKRNVAVSPKVSHSKVKAEPLNILQITDIHYDPNYQVGGNADCGEPMCCRSDQGEPATPEAAAGRWGDYRSCDISFEVITDALTHINNQHQKIDYVYFTGDLVDHAVWATSPSKNNATFYKVMEELKRSFGDIPVFPILGNHEIHPLNVYAPVKITDEEVSSAWLYETMADLWSMWLPADTRETILKGGYYTVLVKPGFRVAVLNNQQCYVYNWWLIYDNKDPDNQLQWLSDVLRQAEKDGERVHILYHIPTGSGDCYNRWSREYNRIINRFEKTVAAQFSGHTHNDEFHIFYSNEEPSRAINVLYTGGSLTSYSNVNSNYRMYTVDSETLDIIDHETWIYNLTAANLSPADSLTWEKMYSFKDAYGVESLSPEELAKLANRMATDEDLMQQYFRFFYLLGDPKLAEGCDTNCLQNLLCGVVSSDSSNYAHCEQLAPAFKTK